MQIIPSLPVVLPLVAAALLVAAAPVLQRRVVDLLAIATAGVTATLCLVLAAGSAGERLVYWFGAWRPGGGVATGIAFVIDPIGAGLAALAAVLVASALVFSWRYFDAVGTLYHALMLVFLAAMAGFCLSGDLFNLFVFFELMSVASYSLTAYKIEDPKPLVGALNFAVTNSVGSFMALAGTGLLYGRTGALNLAQIGRALSAGPADELVIAAFVLVTTGFLIKGAIVPFHFWLADAHAVAPTPVCVLFSGVMVELGLYAAARVYWVVFSGPFGPHAEALRAVWIGAGAVTVVLGAILCVLQRHLKRLLAFSTITHMGMILMSLGLLDARALAGVGIYLLGHGLIKGALFMAAGILLHRDGTVDERALRGRGRGLPLTGVLVVLGGLGLAGLPPFATGFGKSLIEASAHRAGLGWIPWVFLFGSALTGGTVLRAAGRIFVGWGTSEDLNAGTASEGHEETRGAAGRTPVVMLAPAALLVASALVLGLAPGLRGRAESAARQFVDRAGYVAAVLDDRHEPSPRSASESDRRAGTGFGFASSAAAVALAAFLLWRHRLPSGWGAAAARVVRPGVVRLRLVHSGLIADYVTWLVLGAAVYGGLLVVLFRRG